MSLCLGTGEDLGQIRARLILLQMSVCAVCTVEKTGHGEEEKGFPWQRIGEEEVVCVCPSACAVTGSRGATREERRGDERRGDEMR